MKQIHKPSLRVVVYFKSVSQDTLLMYNTLGFHHSLLESLVLSCFFIRNLLFLLHFPKVPIWKNLVWELHE